MTQLESGLPPQWTQGCKGLMSAWEPELLTGHWKVWVALLQWGDVLQFGWVLTVRDALPAFRCHANGVCFFFMKVYIRTVNTCTIYVPSNSLTFDRWTPKHWWQACSTEESPHKYFVRWALIHHLVLESSQGFVAQSQCLFEFTHEWRIKGCSDDRESIKITWKFAEWQGARFLQTRRLKVAVCLLVLASPSVNQIISRSDVEGDQQ